MAYPPRHGRRGTRRGWISFLGRWLVSVVAAGGAAAAEAIAIANARATVTDGWAAGVAAGAGTSLVLAALIAVALLARRRRPWYRGWPQAALIITSALLLVIAMFISTPPKQYGSHRVPYVVTSAIQVAQFGYISACLALVTVVLIAWGVTSLIRERRPPG